MLSILALSLLPFLTLSSYLEVDLSIISFDPPTFNLSFSEPVACPSFQLLMNSRVIEYRML